MFFNKTATVYSKSYDGNNVSSWSSYGTVSCKIEPLKWQDDIRNVNDAPDFEGYRMFARDKEMKPWYKAVIGWDDYIIKKKIEYDGLTSYAIYIISRSQWS
jgi:hypothetical protein